MLLKQTGHFSNSFGAYTSSAAWPAALSAAAEGFVIGRIVKISVFLRWFNNGNETKKNTRPQGNNSTRPQVRQ